MFPTTKRITPGNFSVTAWLMAVARSSLASITRATTTQSLSELADLPLGWWAEREKPGEPWVRHKHEPEEEPESVAE